MYRPIKIVSDDMILSSWDSHKTLGGVAHELGISCGRVAKALSSAGVIINDTHKKILELYAETKSVNEIAAFLKLNPQVIQTYLPRIRPAYGKPNRTTNALRIAKHRTRNKF